MSLTADQKVNMSLDDLIKARQTAEPRKVKKGKVVTVGLASKAAVESKRRSIRGPKPTVNSSTPMEVETKRAARSIGAAVAKRAAVVAQKRGLSNTATATTKAVKKAIGKVAGGPIQTVGRRNNRKKNAVKQIIAPAERIQISFKPAELKQTTEKITALQIAAVLQRGAGKPVMTNKAGGKGRNVKL